MRLIDADKVNPSDIFVIGPMGQFDFKNAVKRLLYQQPIIDAVPVVRCRDCKWFDLYEMECINNAVSTDHEGGASYSLNFHLDDFCSFGERRE